MSNKSALLKMMDELQSLIDENKRLKDIESDFVQIAEKYNSLTEWLYKTHPNIAAEYKTKLIDDLY